MSFLKTYIQNPSPEMPHTSVRPAILIIPGGGYQFVSDREGEVVALAYLKRRLSMFYFTLYLKSKCSFPTTTKRCRKCTITHQKSCNRLVFKF